MNKEILRLALPNIITNITVPLLGMVDLAIIGHIGNETYIGAIAIGTMIFNMIYWNFGFLRMGTSGFTAQAYGADNMKESMNILVRGLTIALAAAILLIILQKPIAYFSKIIVQGSDELLALAMDYFFVRIWAAPATLGLYALKGWYIGMQNSKLPMWIAIMINLLNIVFSLIFVFCFDQGIKGIALGTVLAQYGGLATAIIFWIAKYCYLSKLINFADSLNINGLKIFFKVNGDIFLRTLCLVAVFTFIPVISASMGDNILAANTILMQLFTIFSYIMDGFAHAGESLVGKYIGAKNKTSLQTTVKYLLYWGMILTVLFTVIYAIGSRQIFYLLTNDTGVIDTAMSYIIWAILIPICGFAAFVFDGIYIGATATKSMRNAIFIATAVFFAVYYSTKNVMFNNGLWLAFLFFILLRGSVMWLTLKIDVIYRIRKNNFIHLMRLSPALYTTHYNRHHHHIYICQTVVYTLDFLKRKARFVPVRDCSVC